MKNLEFHIQQVNQNADNEYLLELPEEAEIHQVVVATDNHRTMTWLRVVWSEEVQT